MYLTNLITCQLLQDKKKVAKLLMNLMQRLMLDISGKKLKEFK